MQKFRTETAAFYDDSNGAAHIFESGLLFLSSKSGSEVGERMFNAIFVTAEGYRFPFWGLLSTLSSPNPHRLPSAVAREDEHLLVAAAKKGEVSAFEELVNRYEAKIFRLTRNITGNHEDAEDAMQDAFLKAYAHLQDFHGESRFYTWLVRIAANEALMRLRKRRPNQFSLDEPIESEDDTFARELEDWGPSPEQRYAQAEMQGIVSDVIEKLDPEFRVVLTLRDLEELSTQEAAEVLGISVPAVKSRLLRARLKLREKLNRYFRRGAVN